MRIQRLSSLPDFKIEQSRHFGGVWEVELDAGEQTQPHQHEDLEEIYCFVEGTGEIVIGQRKCPVARGGVVHIPRLTRHWVENTSDRLLRCLAIESLATKLAEEATAKPPARETVGSLEKMIHDLPKQMDQAAAIQQIVGLFDVAGRLSEQIEEAFGLDNEEGIAALTRIEKKIMDAVVEITRRYRRTAGGLDSGGFGGRLHLS
jgi:mannose-6-phosphate isomerase-like protein (cupin superfamily)